MSEKPLKKYIRVDDRLVEVNSEIYYEIYCSIWRDRKHSQKMAACYCPKHDLWKCDGICPGCKYYASGSEISLNIEVGDGIILADVLPDTKFLPLETVETRELYEALHNALDQLSPSKRSICEYIMAGKSEREIAILMSLPQSTVHYQKKKAFELLRNILIKYL